jgi:hypothetical protein
MVQPPMRCVQETRGGAKRASAAPGLRAFDRRVSGQECNAAAVLTPSAVRRFIRQDSDSVQRDRRILFKRPCDVASSSFLIAQRRGWCPDAFWVVPPHTARINSPFRQGGRQAFHRDIRTRVQTNGPSRLAACRPAVFHMRTALYVLRAAKLCNRMQSAPRPRQSLAAVAWPDDPGISDPWSAGVHGRHKRGLWLRRRVSGSRTALLPSMGRAQHSPAKPCDSHARDGHFGGTQNFRDGLVRHALASKLGTPRLEPEKLLPLPWHSRGIGPHSLGKSAVRLIGRRRLIHWHM